MVEASVQAEIGRIARRQNGVISRRQLIDAGLSPAAIRARVAAGHLYRLHRGVYAVGDPALLPLAAQAAALAAAGPSAVLSHRSAAALWSLATPETDVVDVTLVADSARRRAGVRIHRVRALHHTDVAIRSNLRLTAPDRTLIDFAGAATLPEVEEALSEARAHRLITDVRLEQALARLPANHPGAGRTRAVLQHQAGRTVLRSNVERKFLALIHAAGLPTPEVNTRRHGFEPDFFWPKHKLVVEIDGFAVHGSRPAFERDRRRDQVLAGAGIQVVRATELQIDREPLALAVRISQALTARIDLAA